MPEVLSPIPKSLPPVSDSEYQSLVVAKRIRRPKWSSRHSPLKLHQGYSHINEHCVTCKGTGSFRWLKNGEPTDYLCPCLDQWTLDLTLAAAHISPDLRVLGVDDATSGIPQDSFQWMADRIENESRVGSIIMGSSGSGKSLMASLIMRAYLRQGRTAFITRANEMRDFKTAAFDEKGDAKADIEARYARKIANVDLLVVDELERVKTSEFMVENFAHLLSDRRSQGQPTILIAGEDPSRDIVDVNSIADKYWEAAGMITSMDFHKIKRESFWTRLFQRESEEQEKGLTRPRVLS